MLYLSSPMIADSVEAAEVIRNQSEIKRTLMAARGAHVALLGIGALDPATSSFVKNGFMTADEMRGLAANGAVGDIAGQIFDGDGALYPCAFNQRVIGVRFDDLRHIPTTIAVAAGRAKTRAILGALRTGVVDVLCTDEQTANAVLQTQSSETEGR